MKESVSVALVSLFFLGAVSGCSLFGKKKEADAYDPALDPGATAQTYPAYQPTGGQDAYGASGSRYHTVSKKDTLYSIARLYYNGDQSRWKEIYAANKSSISDPNRITVGQRLVIP